LTEAELARDALARCRVLAGFSEQTGAITRAFLTESIRACHSYLSRWMESLAMQVKVDAAGNLRGVYDGQEPGAPRILIGSHLDTVPDAGAYDGVLGVVIGLGIVQLLRGERLPFGIEVIGFSDEEGVRFGQPFIGSRALIGTLDQQTLHATDGAGISIEQAIRAFGLDPSQLRGPQLAPAARAYLEFHIEQGPVLESIGAPLAVVDRIAGQSRAVVTFRGSANHAGATPMHLRRDALCGAAEWTTRVEKDARATEGLVATVGKIEAKPGASNVIPGEVCATLDVRHAVDAIRRTAVETFLETGRHIANERGLAFESKLLLDQNTVSMDADLTKLAERAMEAAGVVPYRMTSGAGHDAMILAPKLPSAMIFLRSPGGISHHPDETVNTEDVALALRVGVHLLHSLSACSFLT
jgi:allantoate deiminase